MASNLLETSPLHEEEEEENGDDEEQQGEAWNDWESDADESPSDYLCLFCDTRFASNQSLFDHCKSRHSFDFRGIVKGSGLDFYGAMKLINYVRSQVAQLKCSNWNLFGHKDGGKQPWEDDIYLQPFMEDDALLHSFMDDEEDEEDDREELSREEVMRELMKNEALGETSGNGSMLDEYFLENVAGSEDFGEIRANGIGETFSGFQGNRGDKQLRISFANVAAREIKNVNEGYFGSYGSFCIHREMLSDKVRTDAYRDAILHNPSLLKQSTVLDVGCGTGILSLFAAQAGASRVIAVEASSKMASVAAQIAKDNGVLLETSGKGTENQSVGVINVVNSMVEDLDKNIHIQPYSVDVLVSEWMGYCLLYESMLTSVLYARDHWLKPGGAILPDTATIFIAGVGRGGTSLPFWENVYGFNMSCIGKEVVEDAAKAPIVDVVDSKDIVTEAAPIKFLDLATMTSDDVDFTATTELVLKPAHPAGSADEEPNTCRCHGIVLWFETGFTSRFCKEMPVVLSTSPYGPSTHWSQTIFTFQESIAMTSAQCVPNPSAALGTDHNPVSRIRSRISIVRSPRHRSIDISVETIGIGLCGRKRSWPVQMFNL